MHKRIIRTSGFIGCFLLTMATFILISYPEYFQASHTVILSSIFGFAFLQSLLQLVCFIDIWKEEGPSWNFHFFIATLSIVAIVIIFTIWVMYHLNANMMPLMDH